ncbi:MAG: glycosyltransferase family 39 protein [Theionarchaea archaeon]|nr:glycosyltransferase family 39 protein [Theionarchaea archaeon]
MNKLLVLVLISSLTLLSLTLIERGFTYDECVYLSIGRNLSKNYTDYTMNEKYMLYRPPVHPYAIAATSYLTGGYSEEISLFVTPFFSLLLIILFYYGISHYYNNDIAFFSTLFLALCPLFVRHSILVLNHSEFALFFFLALLTFRKGLSDNSCWFCLSGFLGGIAFLTRYTGLMYFPVIGIYIFLERRFQFYREKGIILAFLSFLIPVLPWAFFSNEVYNGYSEFASMAIIALPKDDLVHTLQFIGLTVLELTPFFAIFAMLGIKHLKKDTFFISYGLGALLTLTLLNHREPRFILDFSPALALSCGVYVYSIYKRRKKIIYVLVIILFLQSVGESIFTSSLNLHIKEAGLFIAESSLKGAIIADEESQMYYYTQRKTYFFPPTKDAYEQLLDEDIAFVVINQCSPPAYLNEIVQGSYWKPAFVSEKGCGALIFSVKKPIFYLL